MLISLKDRMALPHSPDSSTSAPNIPQQHAHNINIPQLQLGPYAAMMAGSNLPRPFQVGPGFFHYGHFPGLGGFYSFPFMLTPLIFQMPAQSTSGNVHAYSGQMSLHPQGLMGFQPLVFPPPPPNSGTAHPVPSVASSHTQTLAPARPSPHTLPVTSSS